MSRSGSVCPDRVRPRVGAGGVPAALYLVFLVVEWGGVLRCEVSGSFIWIKSSRPGREGAPRDLARVGGLRRFCLVFVVWIDGWLKVTAEIPRPSPQRGSPPPACMGTTGGWVWTGSGGAIEGPVERGPIRIPVVRPFVVGPGRVHLPRDLLHGFVLRGQCRLCYCTAHSAPGLENRSYGGLAPLRRSPPRPQHVDSVLGTVLDAPPHPTKLPRL